jgi:toxin ParE1/3/4
MAKPVELRQLAVDDIDAAVSYYLRETGETRAGRFIDALETGLGHLSRHPLTGSLRYSYELGIPNLRAWTLSRFPYIIFYADQANSVDVWRVLHAKSDIPAWLTSPEDP